MCIIYPWTNPIGCTCTYISFFILEEVSGESRAIEDKQETEIGAVAIQAEDRGTETYHISYNVSTIQEIQPIGHPVSHPVIRAVIHPIIHPVWHEQKK